MSHSLTEDTFDSESDSSREDDQTKKNDAKSEKDSYDSEFDSTDDATNADSPMRSKSPVNALSTSMPVEADGKSDIASRRNSTTSNKSKSSTKSKKRRSSRAGSAGSGSQSEGENDQLQPPEVVLRRAHRRIRRLLKASKSVGRDAGHVRSKGAVPFDATALDDFIRCIPLSRIIFGDFHWRLARSYADLALAYLDIAQLPVQSQEHAATAKTLLTQNVHLSDNPLEKVGILETFLITYYTLGRSCARLDKDSEAEKSLQKAEKIHAEYSKLSAVDPVVVAEWEIKIALAIARLNTKRKSFIAAEDEFQRCLTLLETFHESASDPSLVPVLLDLAKMKLSVGTKSQIESSIEFFLRAHTINIEENIEAEHDLTIARSSLAAGQAYAALDSDDGHASAEAYIRKAVESMQVTLGGGDEESQAALGCLAKLLVRMTKNSEAVDVLKAKIRGRFEIEGGEFSEALAADHNLIANIHLAGGDMDRATLHLKKCLDIRKIVLGPNHRKTKDTMATINSISH